jgi:hypothetical protein
MTEINLGMPEAPPPVLNPRRKTRQIKVGKVGVGSDSPVSVQSMTTTLTSDVSVVVIDWTDTGDSLPTPTLPTLIWRVLRRGCSTGGGASGMPRLISVMPLRLLTHPP